MSKEYCHSIYGNFSTRSCYERNSSSDCYFEGTCCIYNSETGNTKCLNTTEAKCNQYNGLYTAGRICNLWEGDEDYFSCPTNFCNTQLTGKCCSKGRCFNLTQNECFAIPGTLFWPGLTCTSEIEDSVCCYAENNLGACCKPNNECEDGLRANECTDGIFMGAGTFCDQSNCCGHTGNSMNYFTSGATSCKALGPDQIFNCLKIGDKLTGGYFAGFVGMPNPCSFYQTPQIAFGEPLECMINPRGNMVNDQTWRCKTCLSNAQGSNNGSIQYFARTYPDRIPLASLSSKCLLKTGVPFVQQVYSLPGITWPDARMYIDSPGYNTRNGTYAYQIVNSGLALEYMQQSTNLYKYLASDVYGNNKIQILWALIVGPEDVEIEGNRKLKWGMSEGRHIPGSTGAPTQILLEEVTTYPVDGLLTTRIYDRSSTQNPKRWFRDLDEDGIDSKAFFRFSVGSGSMWNPTVSSSSISNNINAFKQAYTKLWEDNNPYDSAIRSISNINDATLYGYRDWYIPSITELNYIYGNLETLNTSLLLDGARPLAESEYWSSTSVCRLTNWNALDHTNKDLYKLEPIDASKEPYLSVNRITSTNQFQLSEFDAYKFTMSVCNGQKMLTQVFNSNIQTNKGKMLSRFRNNKVASLRPVRRIPLVVTCNGFWYNENIMSYDMYSGENKCAACIDNLEGMCTDE